MTKKIKFLEDCIFQRDLIYKKDKLYAIKYEDNTHYIVPDEFDNENELSKVCSIFDYEITEEPKVTKYIKIVNGKHLHTTLDKWYEINSENNNYYCFMNDAKGFTSVCKEESNYLISEGHPWKHLIKKAAELAEETMDVGKHFQMKTESGEWVDYSCTTGMPNFAADLEYRLKPRTIKIGNREISAPEREPLEEGQAYYTPVPHRITKFQEDAWSSESYHIEMLRRGLVFLNKKDAIEATEAMIELLRGSE